MLKMCLKQNKSFNVVLNERYSSFYNVKVSAHESRVTIINLTFNNLLLLLFSFRLKLYIIV
jgi:hypothetical protein